MDTLVNNEVATDLQGQSSPTTLNPEGAPLPPIRESPTPEISQIGDKGVARAMPPLIRGRRWALSLLEFHGLLFILIGSFQVCTMAFRGREAVALISKVSIIARFVLLID
ncbi:hypothetical protein CRG98_027254 [Punica granatum]|uniref:Uncharacterized protein n=1 Tax=Punica granatum TaxID=22663 RepID=A0A2I0J7X5_PUNGR|nr:hypothetical protein CRG98_027254 [Punica granatum]